MTFIELFMTIYGWFVTIYSLVASSLSLPACEINNYVAWLVYVLAWNMMDKLARFVLFIVSRCCRYWCEACCQGCFEIDRQGSCCENCGVCFKNCGKTFCNLLKKCCIEMVREVRNCLALYACKCFVYCAQKCRCGCCQCQYCCCPRYADGADNPTNDLGPLGFVQIRFERENLEEEDIFEDPQGQPAQTQAPQGSGRRLGDPASSNSGVTMKIPEVAMSLPQVLTPTFEADDEPYYQPNPKKTEGPQVELQSAEVEDLEAPKNSTYVAIHITEEPSRITEETTLLVNEETKD